ncbi:hypothetical protein ACJX0J_034814, partial [Zea mays]
RIYYVSLDNLENEIMMGTSRPLDIDGNKYGFGISEKVRNGNGSEFRNSIMHELCDYMGIKHDESNFNDVFWFLKDITHVIVEEVHDVELDESNGSQDANNDLDDVRVHTNWIFETMIGDYMW